MTTALETVVDSLEKSIRTPARCAIPDEGCPDEASLMGTRDGLLNLALTLVRIVSEYDNAVDAGLLEKTAPSPDGYWLPEENAYWSGAIKKVFYQLPTNSPFIVGCYLFPEHERLLDALEKSVQADLPEGVKLRNDPDFVAPT